MGSSFIMSSLTTSNAPTLVVERRAFLKAQLTSLVLIPKYQWLMYHNEYSNLIGKPSFWDTAAYDKYVEYIGKEAIKPTTPVAVTKSKGYRIPQSLVTEYRQQLIASGKYTGQELLNCKHTEIAALYSRMVS